MQEVVKNNNELMTIKETDFKTSDPFLDQAMAAAIKSTESAQLSKSEADRAKREADRAEQEATGAEQAQRSASVSAVSAMDASMEARSALVASQKIQVQVDASKNEVNQLKKEAEIAQQAAQGNELAALASARQASESQREAAKSALKSQQYSEVSEAAQNVTIAARDQAVIIQEDIKRDKAAVSTSQQQAEQAQRAARLSQQAAHDSEVAALGSKNAAFKSEQSAFNSMEQAQAAAKGSAETAAASKEDADRSKREADRTQGQADKAEAAKIAAKDSQYKAKESELLIMGNIDQAEQSKIWAGKYADNAKASEQKALDAINGVVIKDDYDHGMTKATFFALAEKRKRDSAGSGFLEWGTYFCSGSAGSPINQGMWTHNNNKPVMPFLHLGRLSSGEGISRTKEPIVLINGVQHLIKETLRCYGSDFDAATIKFPPAPDGTKTYDSATGEVVQHLDAEAAFAAETETNKVITTRKDLVFLETWHERLSTHDLFNPLGNSQFGANSWEGLTLKSDLVPQGYSAFGEWDTETIGYGFKWSTLTAAQRKKLLSDPRNNIYLDPEINDYIQVKYRIRVVEGVDDNPVIVTPAKSLSLVDAMTWRGAPLRIARQESDTVSKDFNQGKFYATANNNGNPVYGNGDYVFGIGLSFALPICLVQRLNQGAYHPVWNSAGCKGFGTQSDKGSTNHWYSQRAFKPKSTKDCFILDSNTNIGGSIEGGTLRTIRPASDPYKFYDAIYAGLVEDLRLSANKQDYNRLLEDSIKKAVRGETRGRGKVPFSDFFYEGDLINLSYHNSEKVVIVKLSKGALPFNRGHLYGGGSSIKIGSIIIDNKPYSLSYLNITDPSFDYAYLTNTTPLMSTPDNKKVALSSFTLALPQYDILPQCDLIGSPEALAATFPDGVAGSWIANIPDGTEKEFSLTRKNSGSTITRVYSDDNGATWNTAEENINQVKNSFTANLPATRVELWNYSSPSNFTEPANNSQVLSVGDVFSSSCQGIINGARLTNSLTGAIPAHHDRYTLGYSKTQYFNIETNNKIQEFSFTYPKHNPIIYIGMPQWDSSGSKTIYTLTSKDGLLYMQYNGQELKYKTGAVNPWGDTVAGTEYTAPHGVIPIVNGEGTKQDLNGQTVKTFCHHELIPIGIADATESTNAQTLAVNEAVTLPVYPHPDDNGEAPEQGQVLPMNPAETLPLE